MIRVGRLAALALGFIALFTILFTRLWFVQVASGAEYESEAEDQRVKNVSTQSARGDILDRDGVLLATSELRPAVFIDPTQLDAEERASLVQGLAGLAGLSPRELAEDLESAGDREFRATSLTSEQAAFVEANRERFPGVRIAMIPQRSYPFGSLMAHVLGHINDPSEDDIEVREVHPDSDVGKAGVEGFYDDTLRGVPGWIIYDIDRQGVPLGQAGRIASDPGSDIFLTLDVDLQRAVEQALADGIANSQLNVDDSNAEHGAVVVLDARTGAVRAMASFPSFDPNLFVTGLSTEDFAELNENRAFNNLAIQGLFNPGSTFKVFSYLVAMEEGLFPERASHQTHDGTLFCDGVLDNANFAPGSQQVFTDTRAHGTVNLGTALGDSCNIYFWEVALRVWRDWAGTSQENIIQDYARRAGLDEPTGIDLPFESGGVIPDRELYELWAEEAPYRLSPERLSGDIPVWLGGDLMNVVIGQGDVTVTPLQMAVAYSALVNGGQVYQPFVVDRIQSNSGDLEYDAEPFVLSDLGLSDEFLSHFNADLTRTTTSGTARGAFSVMDNPWQVGGKTGTATRDGATDTAWFVGAAPIENPQWVVAVVIEEGGGGGRVAAPVARSIFQFLLGEQQDPIIEGS